MKRLCIKDLAEADRPREKLLQKGIASLSDAELLAILIASGNDEETAVELSQRILRSADNNLNELGKYDVKKLASTFKGIGQVKALTIIAALELGKRRKTEEITPKSKILCSRDIFLVFHSYFLDIPHEEFWMLLLSRSNQIKGKVKIGQGGISETSADVRLILREAINGLACAIVLCHNHPSGNNYPSRQDDLITEQVNKAAGLLNMVLLDHVIVTENGFYSYADEGKL